MDTFDIAEANGWVRFSKIDAKSGPRKFFCCMFHRSSGATVKGEGSTRAAARVDAGVKAMQTTRTLHRSVARIPGLSETED